MSIEIGKLQSMAEKIADDKTHSPGEFHPGWGDERDKALITMVLEQAALKCRSRIMGDLNREDAEAERCAEAIEAMKPKDAK